MFFSEPSLVSLQNPLPFGRQWGCLPPKSQAEQMAIKGSAEASPPGTSRHQMSIRLAQLQVVFFLFEITLSLYNFGWPRAFYVAQANLEVTEIYLLLLGPP